MAELYGVDVSELEDCKLASGKPGNHGYYRKSFKNKVYLAHRLAYVLAYGKPPTGYEVHHLCHNRQCIEPTHLVALTPAEHRLQEIRERGLSGAAKDHAAKIVAGCGHKFDAFNGRQRYCSRCLKQYKHEWYIKQNERLTK